jgi:hypothetical protein
LFQCVIDFAGARSVHNHRVPLCPLWFVLPAVLTLAAAAAQPLGRTDPNGGLFPDSSLADFRFLLDAPAGKYGFLGVSRNGRFVWPNGKRARFWGVNISNHSVFIGREQIDRVADVLARAGTNMVRFEALDSADGLLDPPGSDSSRALDETKLALLDYWIAKLRERGIYYYLDLLDFRQFKPGDEVPAYDRIGRAAKPYACFDRRLIELQKEYARRLLTHRNPLTGLRYVDDPALALVEICNEHGLFMKAGSLDALVEPYGAELQQQWNRWLLQRYGTRDGLKAAWGRMAGAVVLGDAENPADFSVKLPLFTPGPPPPPLPAPGAPRQDLMVADARRAPGRLRDGVRFLYETQRGYFREMKAYLREIGLKVPVTGVVSNEIVPDVASAAAELDFTSENYYADHPAFAGKDWEGTFFYNDTDPLRSSSTYQIAPWLAALRWENKPVVVREWATVWPNRYRAVAVPEMAAYAALQDFDAVLLFGYQTYRTPDILSDFDHQADPTVWGLYALGALVFLRGDISPALWNATLNYTPDTLFRWPNELANLHRLAWFVRLNSRLGDAGKRGNGKGATTTQRPNALSVWPTDSLSSVLNMFGRKGAGVNSKMLETGALASSTGEIVRRTQDGLLTITTPRAVALCGEMPVGKRITVGDWSLVTPTAIGAFMAVSLDGKPLRRSRHYVVKMVSRAENTAQELESSPAGAPARFHLKTWGRAPVRTFGRAVGDPVMILRRGKQVLLSLAIADGVWELLVRDGQATLVCDTRAIRGTLLGRSITTGANTPLTVDARPDRVTAADGGRGEMVTR